MRPLEPVHRKRRLGAGRRERARLGASTISRACARSGSASASSTRGSWRASSASRHPSDGGLGRHARRGTTARRSKDLAARRVNVVFSVDLFNEGIDVPVVDTLLMLRPTDSPTLFLQQLGRGLRRDPARQVHGSRFRRPPSKGVSLRPPFPRAAWREPQRPREQVEQGFPFLPAGCHMELDRVASEIVLANIREAVPSRWIAQGRRAARDRQGRRRVTLGDFLEERGSRSRISTRATSRWSDSARTQASPCCRGPNEEALRRACGRLLHVDDQRRIDAYRRLLQSDAPPDPDALRSERRLLRMLVASIVDKAVTKRPRLAEACRSLVASAGT